MLQLQLVSKPGDMLSHPGLFPFRIISFSGGTFGSHSMVHYCTAFVRLLLFLVTGTLQRSKNRERDAPPGDDVSPEGIDLCLL
jgi:hypothetical protein